MRVSKRRKTEDECETVRHERQIGRQRSGGGFRVRNRLKRDATRPRLVVFRSHKHMYAQMVDD